MRKKILMVGYNFHPEPTGIGKYSGEMMTWLAQQGHDCTIITSYPYYPFWKIQEPYHARRFGYHTEVTRYPSGGALHVHRCPMYVPANPSGAKRMLLELTFFASAFFKLIYLLLQRQFQYVICVAPPFQIGLLGVLTKKLQHARLIYHVQDLQIEAARDLQMIKSKAVLSALFKAEDYIFRQAEVVSSISTGMIKKIQEKARKAILLFPNWADTATFYPLPQRELLKTSFGFAATDKVVLYSGAIGEKQGLEAIIYAANALQQYSSFRFVICGSGPYKEKLESLANSLQLHNVVFFPLQPAGKFNDFLNMADVHLVIQKVNAGDLVMPSKLTTLLAVGALSIVTANPGSSLHSLIEEYQAGLVVEAENQTALNATIIRALTTDHQATKENARRYAEQFLNLDKVMSAFEKAALT